MASGNSKSKKGNSRKDVRKQLRLEKKQRNREFHLKKIRGNDQVVSQAKDRPNMSKKARIDKSNAKQSAVSTESPHEVRERMLANRVEEDEEISSDDGGNALQHDEDSEDGDDQYVDMDGEEFMDELEDDDNEMPEQSMIEEEADSSIKPKAKKVSKRLPLDEDEMEIARLEKKLGISGKDGWKNIEKGLLGDGFDPELIEFLREGETSLKADRFQSTEAATPSASDSSEDEDGNDDFEEEADPLADAPTTYLPAQNIYGDRKMKDESLMLAAKGQTKSDPALDKKIRALLNRTSQENASRTLKEIRELFNQYAKGMVIDSLNRLVMDGSSSATSLLFATLALAVDASFSGLVAQMVETIVKQVNIKQLDPSKLRLLGNFCALGAVAPSLSADILLRLSAEGDEIVPSIKEEAIVSLVESCGWKIRAEDASGFRNALLAASSSTGSSQRLELHAKNKADYAPEEARVKSWRKWLQREVPDGATLPAALAVPFEDFLTADTNGRWWILGASWNAAGGTAADGTTASAGIQRKELAKQNDAISQAIDNATDDMLVVAERQGMKTKLRKAVFCTIMSVEDYIQAFDGILRLDLNDSGEREAVRVIMHCAIRSKRYNPFFGLLGSRLCSYQPRYRFSFQLAIWDEIKLLDSTKLTMSQVSNFSRFVAEMIIQFSLSLSIFKLLNFAKISSKEKLWFLRDCFIALLMFPDDDQEETGGGGTHSSREGDLLVANIFSRLKGSKDGVTVRDGVLVFWSRTEPFMSATKTKDPLLYKRLGVARRVMEHYVKTEDKDDETS